MIDKDIFLNTEEKKLLKESFKNEKLGKLIYQEKLEKVYK
jgi:hypothetical protein